MNPGGGQPEAVSSRCLFPAELKQPGECPLKPGGEPVPTFGG
ncbi:hypothetical protein D187_000769 [Cystobacter fuscus DSM 2262]|uniref:Uncharacterized protein n=1 Tax=Cystobacter fuscus (strain ATCC 25194 / DSM 2262 / NBRC 100088 / M29) TaxID=1242864 RepID=S9R8B5_CYSF2|nr:hypothetical protein D187_000769 [Cystobacter fuscus DSM 2262]